jgi:hypothetical protein
MRTIKTVMAAILIGTIVCVCAQSSDPVKNGYVPDKETAIKIAEAVWKPVYGDKINNSRPFVAELRGRVWVVQGTLHSQKGGVPYIEIQKSDCKILKMYHGK